MMKKINLITLFIILNIILAKTVVAAEENKCSKGLLKSIFTEMSLPKDCDINIDLKNNKVTNKLKNLNEKKT